MKNETNFPIRNALFAFWLVLLGYAMPATAQTLSLPDSPLFLSNNVKPNIIFAIDDSGSMNDEVLLAGNDGSLWWRTGASGSCPVATANSFVGCISDGTTDFPSTGILNFNNTGGAGGSWRNYVYLFPNGYNGTYDGHLIYNDSAGNGHYSIPPIPQYGWTRSTTYNPSYFDPAQTYIPWPTFTAPYANSVPSAAPSDPTRPGLTFDLTQDIASGTPVSPALGCPLTVNPFATNGNRDFLMQVGMVIPEGTCYSDTTGIVWKVAPVGGVSIAAERTIGIRYFPATFYLPATTLLPAGFGYTGPTTPTGLSPDGGTTLNHYELKPGNFATVAQYNSAIQNFANWFTYYRKRHLAMRGGVGGAFKDQTNLRVDAFTINNPTTVTMNDLGVPAQKNALFERIYGNNLGNAFVGNGGTPNRTAVKKLGDQFKRTDTNAPIQYACQQNFGILFTDGYSNGSSDTAFSSVGNVDGTSTAPSYGFGTAPYTDNQSGTIADGVASLYRNPLRTDLTAGRVRVPQGCTATVPLSSLDCNPNLHMNFYAVTLGTRGYQFGVNVPATGDPYANPPTWPTSFPDRSPSSVDDLWHATINSRGLIFNARRPSDIANGLGAVLNDIAAKTGSASSLSLNSTSLNTGTLVFQASFNSANWSGEFQAFPVSTSTTTGPCPSNPIGTLCGALWSASSVLNGQNFNTGRTIFSYNPVTRTPVPFRWANLNSAQQALLNLSDSNIVDTNGALRLNYIRGDQTQEAATASPKFRVRATVLGDLIDSDPFFVGRPRASYGFDNYRQFRIDQRNRTPVVYVSGNDGMLHGFRASDGQELLAYVPSTAFGTATLPLLAGLTRANFVHRNIVDGSPTVGDAFIGGAWKSVLVGGLRSGGKGIYALDVTNPTTNSITGAAGFSESNASTVLWEFTSADDPDLGNTYSQPVIVKLNNGRWAAIVGNGYNSGGSGQSTLFIIYLDGPSAGGWVLGTNYLKISTGVGTLSSPNGLASPAPIDIDRDGTTDYVYAGDQSGRIWRFNLTGMSPAAWGVAYNQPLFIATDAANNIQAITERPDVGYNTLASNPTNATSPKLVVYFGTGQYLATGDNIQTGQPTQSFYGIFDDFGATPPSPSITRTTNLLQQKILLQVNQSGTPCTAAPNCFRVSTANTLDISAQKGWYIDLYNTLNGSATGPNLGERQVTTPVLRGGRIIFTTLIPSSDPCDAGGTSWLMELNAKSGSRLATSAIDINHNGTVDVTGNTDNINIGTTGAPIYVAASGTASGGGIQSSVSILSLSPESPGLEVKLRGQSQGGIASDLESASGRNGRITWRQVIK